MYFPPKVTSSGTYNPTNTIKWASEQVSLANYEIGKEKEKCLSSSAGLANSKWIVLKYNTILVELYWIARQTVNPRIVLEWIVQFPPHLELY